MIGLYLSPGLIFALPGGAVGRILGDKRTVLIGLGLMTLGGLASAFGTTWEMQLAGRVIAGVGGVVLNVLMSKMVTDRFEGREIATAMAIFVNSWPAGIALALLIQPLVANMGGMSGAHALTAIFAAAGFAALLTGYRETRTEPGSGGGLPRGSALAGVLIAGAIWGLYNAAYAMIFAFGPILLTGRGWTLTEASSLASLAICIGVLTTPIGGILADRSGRPNLVMVSGLLLMALALIALPRFEFVVTSLVAFGVVSGLPIGAIMSLPARVLKPTTRALGMGLFFVLFYCFVVTAPLVAGALLETTGWDGAAMDLGAVALIGSIVLLLLFERAAKRENGRT